MTRSIRVAALQLRARDRNEFARSVHDTMNAARGAATDADLLVLPEATLPAYVIGQTPLDEPSIDEALHQLKDIARSNRTVIVAGAVAKGDPGIRNSAFVIDSDGSLAGRTDKLFLWHFDRRWFTRGDRLAPIQTSIGKLGVLICADGRIPTIARTLVDGGAEILVMPTAWVTSGRDPSRLENVQADLLARVRAYENRAPFVAANKCGAELGMVLYCGKSQVVSRDGAAIALAGQHEPETVAASVDLAAVPPRRATPSEPAPRVATRDVPVRIAISFDPLPQDIDERLAVLDDDYALATGDDPRIGLLDATVPTAAVGDSLALDPGGLVPYRLAGYQLICWTADAATEWVERIARARALELRLYIVVFDRTARRAYAVDPDGTMLAGTFSDFRLASFLLEPRKTRQTAVAPGTDILEGLTMVRALAQCQEKAPS